ncbi:MAG: hypothetical protein EOO75_14225, partial [Myxococcales bacterium]
CCDAATDFCEYESHATCGTISHCQKKPTGDCPATVEEVCGCDGKIYANGCEAQKANTDWTFDTFECSQSGG